MEEESKPEIIVEKSLLMESVSGNVCLDILLQFDDVVLLLVLLLDFLFFQFLFLEEIALEI